jgi:fumarate hydratase subunit alpha
MTCLSSTSSKEGKDKLRSPAILDLKTRIKAELAQLGTHIDPKVEQAIKQALAQETSEIAQDILNTLLENYTIGRQDCLPICQDTGTVVFFVEMGEDVCLTGGSITDALQESVREVWQEQYYRASILKDPLFDRTNTKDNTPAIIHTELVKGDKLTIRIALKGGGAENMSTLRMLKPSDGKQGIKAFVLDSVIKAGGNPCPPILVGIGIGGNFETCAYLAKKALLREFASPHPVKEWADFEAELLQAINETNIGPQGLGGKTTALAVQIETAPCHLASLPVAVNLNCHAHRHCTIDF